MRGKIMGLIFSLLVCQCLATRGMAAAVPFGTPVPSNMYGETPIGDYDGDGDNDFLAKEGDSWVVYENNGRITPSFTPRTLKLTYPTWLTNPQDVYFYGFHDFDHDGHMECLLKAYDEDSSGDRDACLFLGTWKSPGNYNLQLIGGADSYSDINWGYYSDFSLNCILDMDKDGIDDILYDVYKVNWTEMGDEGSSDSIEWIRGLPGSPIQFNVPQDIDTIYADSFTMLEFTDFTKDGLEDLVRVEYGEEFYDGDSSRITDVGLTFYPRTQKYPPTFGSPISLMSFPDPDYDYYLDQITFITTDYDADGDKEILLKDQNDVLWGLDNIEELANHAFSSRASGSREAGSLQKVQIDSNVRKIIPGYGSRVIIQKDDGFWILTPSSTAPGGVTRKLLFRSVNADSIPVVEDFDRNGQVDVLGIASVPDPVNSTNSIRQLRYFPGSIQLPLGYYLLAKDSSFDSLNACDLNGDQFKDIFFGSRYILNSASQIFTTHSLASSLNGIGAVCAVDLDKDGQLDVLGAASDLNLISWRRNSGQPKPAFSAAVLTTEVNKPAGLVAADLDQDGDLDLAVASAGDNTVAWFENKGLNPPSFMKHALTTQASGAAAVAVADLDGDGDPDILAASPGNNTLWWFENQGGTPPAFKSRKISTSAGGVCAVAVADLDGDGDRDVVCGAKSDDKVIWFESNGQRPPAFTARTVTSKADSVRSVCAADLDHDGDLDLVSASNDDDTIAWYENNGAKPPVWTRRVITAKADGARSVTAADLDGDGDLDVLAASANDGVIAWFENDGGSPLKWWRRPVDLRASGVAGAVTGDLNGDGKPDVVGALKSLNRVNWYENCYIKVQPQTRAAAWGLYQ